MKSLVMTAAALAAIVLRADEEAAADPVRDTGAENLAELAARYADSVAVVRYYVKKGAKGDSPDFDVPYKCPHCDESHFSSSGVSDARGIPAEFEGFVVEPDVVATADVMIPPEYVVRIEVSCAGETVSAAEFEACPERKAVFLKTERPLTAAKPLRFAAGGVDVSEAAGLYIVCEDGETVAGTSPWLVGGPKLYPDSGVTVCATVPNVLVVDDDGDAVTLSFSESAEVRDDMSAPPSAWLREPASLRFERLAAAEARVRRAVVPVTLRFEVGRKSNRVSLEDIESETVGVLVEGGRVIIPKKLDMSETERLDRMEAVLEGGRRVALEFVGSFADTGAIAARFADGVPEGLEPFRVDARDPRQMRREDFFAVNYAAPGGGELGVSSEFARVKKFGRECGGTPVLVFESFCSRKLPNDEEWSGWVVLSKDGGLVEMSVPERRPGRHYEGDSDSPQCARLASLATSTDFDPENAPRRATDRYRSTWFGADVQVAGEDVVKKLRAGEAVLRHGVSRPALVVSVSPDSPAAALGVKEGDILLSARHVDSSKNVVLNARSDYGSVRNWEKILASGEVHRVNDRVSPWPVAGSGVNETFSNFGVGARVAVTWFSDGRLMTGETALTVAPTSFANAPRARNNDLGITVCDMTYEVRKFLKLADDAPGVVVRRIKPGGVAAVAKISAYETIEQVNGEDVMSARDFLAKTKGRKDLVFKVRRITTTRIVPVKL